MDIKEKKLENATMELEIHVPSQKVELEYKSVFDGIQKTVKLDGFRKGKAPLQMIEARYMEYADQEVAENLVKSAFIEALQEKQLTPIAQPLYNFDTISRGNDFVFTAVFEIPPTVELGKYTEVPAEERVCKISDDDIKREKESMLEKDAKFTPKDAEGRVVKGDFVKIKVKRIDDVDEAERDSVEFRDYSFIVGKNDEDYHFDKHVIDMKADEEREVKIKYPKDYQVSDLAGQKTQYILKMIEINSVELPELDDEFAKNHGYESLEDLGSKTREYLEKYVSEKTKAEAKSQIIRAIVEDSTFDLPESMIQAEMSAIFRKTGERIGYYEDDIDAFCSMVGLDVEEFKGRLREEALSAVKTTLVLSEIARAQELKVPEEKYREVVERIAKSNGKSVEEIDSLIAQNNSRENIESELLLDLSMDYVYENAKIKKLKAMSLQDLMRTEAPGGSN